MKKSPNWVIATRTGDCHLFYIVACTELGMLISLPIASTKGLTLAIQRRKSHY